MRITNSLLGAPVRGRGFNIQTKVIMGTPGVRITFDKEEVIQAIKKWNGRLNYASDDLRCAWDTLKKYINKHEDLLQLLSDCRNERDEVLCDIAEDVIQDTMADRIRDGTNALRAAFFILNNKGRSRNYSSPYNAEDPTEVKITPGQIRSVVKAMREEEGLLENLQ